MFQGLPWNMRTTRLSRLNSLSTPVTPPVISLITCLLLPVQVPSGTLDFLTIPILSLHAFPPLGILFYPMCLAFPSHAPNIPSSVKLLFLLKQVCILFLWASTALCQQSVVCFLKMSICFWLCWAFATRAFSSWGEWGLFSSRGVRASNYCGFSCCAHKF